MKKSEENKKFKEMKNTDLIKETAIIRKQSVLMSLKVKAGKHDNNSDAKKARKSLARALTILNQTGENDG
jgi:ribosomal protein L29